MKIRHFRAFRINQQVVEIDPDRFLHPGRLYEFINKNTCIECLDDLISFHDCIDWSAGFCPSFLTVPQFTSYDAVSADGKERFSGFRCNCRVYQAGKLVVDARHIGAVAGAGAVKVETNCRTPYLPFRVYLRFAAKAVTGAQDEDRAKLACFKE